jgi:hypothetical protein
VLARLAKLAHVSAHLRAGAEESEKTAFVAALKLLGGLAAKNPGKALGVAATLGLGGAGALGKKRQYAAGFDPEVQKTMLGPTPTPPGTT